MRFRPSLVTWRWLQLSCAYQFNSKSIIYRRLHICPFCRLVRETFILVFSLWWDFRRAKIRYLSPPKRKFVWKIKHVSTQYCGHSIIVNCSIYYVEFLIRLARRLKNMSLSISGKSVKSGSQVCYVFFNLVPKSNRRKVNTSTAAENYINIANPDYIYHPQANYSKTIPKCKRQITSRDLWEPLTHWRVVTT